MMGLEALIDAARFIELQSNSEAHGSLAALIGCAENQPELMCGSDLKNVPELNCYKNNEAISDEKPRKIPYHMKRKREIHCEQVKGQRAYLKSCLDSLKDELPTPPVDADGYHSRFTTLKILNDSVKVIKELENVDRIYKAQIEKLKNDNALLEERIGWIRDRDQPTFTAFYGENESLEASKPESNDYNLADKVN